MNIPIFVINMPQNTERKNKIESQLSKLGLAAAFIKAVVGKNLSDTEITALYNEKQNNANYHRNLTVGEIGCYASHRLAWKKLVDENISQAIILEDDSILSNTFIEVLENLSRLKEWDIIKLADDRNLEPAKSHPISSNLNCVSYYRVPNCTTGYAISINGAKKFLSRKRFFRPVDVDTQFHSELNLSVIGIRPYSVYPDDVQSEIVKMNTNGYHSNSSTFFRNIKHRLAMMLQRRKVSSDLDKCV